MVSRWVGRHVDGPLLKGEGGGHIVGWGRGGYSKRSQTQQAGDLHELDHLEWRWGTWIDEDDMMGSEVQTEGRRVMLGEGYSLYIYLNWTRIAVVHVGGRCRKCSVQSDIAESDSNECKHQALRFQQESEISGQHSNGRYRI